MNEREKPYTYRILGSRTETLKALVHRSSNKSFTEILVGFHVLEEFYVFDYWLQGGFNSQTSSLGSNSLGPPHIYQNQRADTLQHQQRIDTRV